MGYEPPNTEDRKRSFYERLKDAATGRRNAGVEYERENREREHQFARERQNEEAEPEYRQQVKQSRFLAKQDERVQTEKEEALAARQHQYEQAHPESYGAAAATRNVGGVKDYVRRMQMPSNLRKKTEQPTPEPGEIGVSSTAEDQQRKSNEIRQRRLAAKTQAERERLDNIARAQESNQRFKQSLEAQRSYENRRDFRRSKENPPPEPSWMDQFRARISSADADAKRQARQAKGQKAAVHGPSIAERIKQRTAGIDFGGMLGSAIGVARGEGAEPLPGLSDIKRKVTKGVPAKTQQMSAGFDTRIEAFVAEAKPKAKARLKEIPGQFKQNFRESVGTIGTAYLKSQTPVGKKSKRVATLTSSPLDSMLGMREPRRASFRGRGRGGIGDIGGGIGDIGGMFGGGGGSGVGDITGMFGGGG